MRELILKMSMSLDGFVAGPAGEVEWMFSGDPEAVAWSVAAVSKASLHIMGSRTFHDMAAYWPTATGVFASPMNQIPKAVFSKRRLAILDESNAGHAPSGALQPGAESWSETYVASGDLAGEIAGLKAGDGLPIIAHGGASFARSLIAEDLIDQYVLLVHPVVLGNGMPIFSGVSPSRRLKLISSTAFPGGSVAQIYRPA
ncbi:dihydrofolate reductase family protein [Rhizobium sp. LjRoot98]|uniref:dihydrofolate reductase family protein n=1 Tax=unclassified Rhizobium TaxID=2613769 RepID=UPI00071293B0|nr:MULTISPECIES: dihydrofolate reductase family protein [unclassified Rhizobium]KQV37392.1 dihydrofolate reductase [Rhizobium sp. Root1204]KQY17404.1 dihydrofolate reductase [Rhizobium sp. Root1334]KRC13287.1 dihydrofolate reductase [Rhizobium sp. Root73]